MYSTYDMSRMHLGCRIFVITFVILTIWYLPHDANSEQPVQKIEPKFMELFNSVYSGYYTGADVYFENNDSVSKMPKDIEIIYKKPHSLGVIINKSQALELANLEYVKNIVAPTGTFAGKDISTEIPAPLKQVKSGILPKYVKCQIYYEPVLKAEDGTPACIQDQHVEKFMASGWATTIGNKTWNHYGILPHRTVYFMKSNSTANIVVEYKSAQSINMSLQIYYGISQRGNFTYNTINSTDVKITTDRNSIPLNNYSTTVITYTIKSNADSRHLYWLGLYQICSPTPLVVGLEPNQISSSDIPVFMQGSSCPAQIFQVKITSMSGIVPLNMTAQPIFPE